MALGKLFHCNITLLLPHLAATPGKQELCHLLDLAAHGAQDVRCCSIFRDQNQIPPLVLPSQQWRRAILRTKGPPSPNSSRNFIRGTLMNRIVPNLNVWGRPRLGGFAAAATKGTWGVLQLGKYCMGKKGEVAALCYVLASGDVQVNYYLENKLHCNHNDGESTGRQGVARGRLANSLAYSRVIWR